MQLWMLAFASMTDDWCSATSSQTGAGTASLPAGGIPFCHSSSARISGCISWMNSSAVRYAPAAMANIGQ